MNIEITIGDICEQPDMDAIVNAAKPELTGGGGVDGAVHRAAGPDLLKACLEVPLLGGDLGDQGWRIGRGHAHVTEAFELPNQWVIHTAGPIYKDDPNFAPAVLNACYRNSVVMGHAEGARSIAFPAIGTGIYGYPLLQATVIAVKSILDLPFGYFQDMETIRFVCFDEENWLTYHRVLEGVQEGWKKVYTI